MEGGSCAYLIGMLDCLDHLLVCNLFSKISKALWWIEASPVLSDLSKRKRIPQSTGF